MRSNKKQKNNKNDEACGWEIWKVCCWSEWDRPLIILLTQSHTQELQTLIIKRQQIALPPWTRLSVDNGERKLRRHQCCWLYWMVDVTSESRFSTEHREIEELMQLKHFFHIFFCLDLCAPLVVQRKMRKITNKTEFKVFEFMENFKTKLLKCVMENHWQNYTWS